MEARVVTAPASSNKNARKPLPPPPTNTLNAKQNPLPESKAGLHSCTS
jgi:hypothetical protein